METGLEVVLLSELQLDSQQDSLAFHPATQRVLETG